MKPHLEADGFVTNLAVRIPEKEEVISGREAEMYAEKPDNRRLHTAMVARDIKERLNIQPREGKILEVCCGTGDLAFFVYHQNCNVVHATDGSEELIKAAKFKHYEPCLDLPNRLKRFPRPLSFSIANIHNHFGKGQNKYVICKDAFHHFKDPVTSMNELLELCTPDGLIYLYDLARECPVEQLEGRLATMKGSNPLLVNARRRFLQSVNASWTTEEMGEILTKSEARDFEIIYPLEFSQSNLEHYHSFSEKEDYVKEHTFDRLSMICVIKK